MLSTDVPGKKLVRQCRSHAPGTVLGQSPPWITPMLRLMGCLIPCQTGWTSVLRSSLSVLRARMTGTDLTIALTPCQACETWVERPFTETRNQITPRCALVYSLQPGSVTTAASAFCR